MGLYRRELVVTAVERYLVQPLVPGARPLPVEAPLLRVTKRGRLSYAVGRVGDPIEYASSGGLAQNLPDLPVRTRP
ncbi:MAG: hypothetical protein DLM54_09825 [Acidimicrobiales bacterium]|nr:MAG: hypothetical protein DLM54_09825 [Acidimicrobiales bacterium]